MSIKNFVAVVMMSTITTFGFAGNEHGNGGDVIVCTDQQQVMLLDFYEGQQRYAMEYLSGDNRNAILATVLQRIEQRDPQLHAHLREATSEFLSEALFLDSVELVDIPDSNHVAIPKGCTIAQVAAQKKPLFKEDKRFTINRDLWSRMDPLNQAGLMVHEAIYQIAIKNGHKNSIASRYITASLFQVQNDHINQAFSAFQSHVGPLELPWWQWFVNGGIGVMSVITLLAGLLILLRFFSYRGSRRAMQQTSTIEWLCILTGVIGTLVGLIKTFQYSANTSGDVALHALAAGGAEAMIAVVYALSIVLMSRIAFALISPSAAN